MNITTYKNYNFTPYHHPELGEMLSNKDVALGYGTTIQSLAQAKNNNEDELIEGVHWLRVEVQTKGGKQKVIHWTLDGIHMLGFFIKSDEAKHFRKWASKLITEMKKRYPDPVEKECKDIFAGIQLDNVIPYEFKRELITTKRKLTIEKKKHRGTAELYEQTRKESERLKFELIRVNDALHTVMQKDLSKADITLVLYQLTNRFQTLPSIAKDGQNLNTDTKAGLEYWDEKYKPLIDEARDFENRIKNKMTQQLKLIISTVERDIVNRFEESLEVSVRAVKLPYKG